MNDLEEFVRDALDTATRERMNLIRISIDMQAEIKRLKNHIKQLECRLNEQDNP